MSEYFLIIKKVYKYTVYYKSLYFKMEDSKFPHSTKIRLTLFCSNLTLSNLDTQIELYSKSISSAAWTFQDRTEEVYYNSNPKYTRSIIIDYSFGIQCYLQFKLLNIKDKILTGKTALLGEAQALLSEVLRSQGQKLNLQIKNATGVIGSLEVNAEEMTESKQTVFLSVSAKNLEDRTGWFYTYKPFFSISKRCQDGVFKKVYISEETHFKQSIWKNVSIRILDLCDNDYDLKLLFLLHDSTTTSEGSIAQAEFSFRAIYEGNSALQLFSTQLTEENTSNHAGEVEVNLIEMNEDYSFFDYLKGGCKLNLISAVDFTSSNGSVVNSGYLHTVQSHSMNSYEKMLGTIGDIVLNHTSDQHIHMYGYGAKIAGIESYAFPLTYDNTSQLVGVADMLKSYRSSIRFIEPGKKNSLSTIIETAVSIAGQKMISIENQEYYILLILTSDEIYDMQQTINSIIKASALPISIIIAGIGNSSFRNISMLANDQQCLSSSKGMTSERNILHFASLNEINNSCVEVSKKLLKNIPGDLLAYFKSREIPPNTVKDIATSQTVETVSSQGIPYPELPPIEQLYQKSQTPEKKEKSSPVPREEDKNEREQLMSKTRDFFAVASAKVEPKVQNSKIANVEHQVRNSKTGKVEHKVQSGKITKTEPQIQNVITAKPEIQVQSLKTGKKEPLEFKNITYSKAQEPVYVQESKEVDKWEQLIGKKRSDSKREKTHSGDEHPSKKRKSN